MNIREKIILTILEQVNKLLLDYREPGDEHNLSKFAASQFNLVYPNAYTSDDPPRKSGTYPVVGDDAVILTAKQRIFKSIRIGFIPIADLDDDLLPAMFIFGATDEVVTFVTNQTTNENAFIYPVNLRVVLKEEMNATKDNANIIVATRIREALGYLLDYSNFNGMHADRRGYVYPSIVQNIMIADVQNLEEEASPYEAIDYRIEVTFTEQKSRTGEV